MKQRIIEIDTFIKNKELFFSIRRETDDLFLSREFQAINFQQISKEGLPFSVYELELLEDCFLEPNSFYKRGEKMRNGKDAPEDGVYTKTWKFTYEGTLDELKERNKAKRLKLQSIYSVEISQRNSQYPYVIIRTTENRTYIQLLHLFESLVGIKEEEFYLLTGVFISPVMYKKGEIFQSAGKLETVREDDKMVAKFNFRIEGTLGNHYSIYGKQELKAATSDFSRRDFWHDDNNDRYIPSYKKYNGYNGFDDDTIDNAFEGDPEATWNVD